jgi:hypothetical protein
MPEEPPRCKERDEAIVGRQLGPRFSRPNPPPTASMRPCSGIQPRLSLRTGRDREIDEMLMDFAIRQAHAAAGAIPPRGVEVDGRQSADTAAAGRVPDLTGTWQSSGFFNWRYGSRRCGPTQSADCSRPINQTMDYESSTSTCGRTRKIR